MSTGSATEHLARYLADFAARLGRALWLRAVAVMALAALLLTLAGSWLAIRTGFGGGTLALVRVALLVVLAALAVLLLALPLRRLRRRRAGAVESLAKEFDGRLHTFSELAAQHPFRELLAEDALGIADRHPPHSHVTRARVAVPAVIAAALLAALVWLAALGPGLYRDGARVIWAGWLLRDLAPAQRIAVEPGSEAVRRGGPVTVRSWMQGFVPAGAQLHARVGAGPWEQIDMARDMAREPGATPASAQATRAFTFTFFSVRDPVSYYVSAAGVRSPTFQLQVVDVPGVAQLRLVYHYPAWTRRPDAVQEGNGDISAIADTQVDVQLRTDRPLAGAELVLDSAATPLATSGDEAQGAIRVARDARYYLAARIGTERVRLTDDYLIRVLPVPPPQVRVTWPGRDYSASSIEEVTTDVQASDDYGLQSLELRYSVNGGAWRTVALPVKGAGTQSAGTSTTDQHVFAFESLRPDGAARPLAPGDLVSYYAVARGHAQSSQSDMYFIDVQPFDRRYSQSQASGGAGATNEQEQISQRQREILVSTWNLLREQQQRLQATVVGDTAGAPAAPGAGDVAASMGYAAAALHDNATLLATLQNKLAAQAQSLAERTQARQLVNADPKIARFIDSMKQAAKAMQPAAQHLAATDLSAAVAPEQQALQYLLQAEAQYTDVQVAVEHGNGGGNPQSGRDVAQIYQLEMDLQKNQYESGSGATPQSTDQQADQLARRLQDLARRQQQLSEQLQHSPQLTSEQRWQQQSLQREAENLQQQLQQQRSAQGGAQGQQSGQSAQGSRGAQGSQGAPGAAGSVPDGTEAGGLLAQRVADAIHAMNQAATAMRTDDPHAAQQARLAAQQAQQALAGADTELARERAQQIQQQVAQLADRAGELYAQQVAAAQQLQDGVKAGTLQDGPRFSIPLGVDSSQGRSPQEQLTQQKRELSAGVQRLGGQVASAAQQYRNEAPQTSQALNDAGQGLADSAAASRLDIESRYINEGRASSIVASDAAVTQALRDLHQRLQLAAGVASRAAAAATAQRDPVADELARLRALRGQLQQLADAAQPGSSGANGQGANSQGASAPSGTSAHGQGANGQSGANGQGAGSESRPGAASAASASPGTVARGTAQGGAAGTAGGSAGGAALGGAAGLAGVASAQRAVAAGAAGLVPLLRAQGADERELAQIDRLTRQLGEAAIVTGRAMQLAQQLHSEIDVLDELELQLVGRGQPQAAIRAAVDDRGAEQYREAVAEYYRQLSRQ